MCEPSAAAPGECVLDQDQTRIARLTANRTANQQVLAVVDVTVTPLVCCRVLEKSPTTRDPWQ